MASIAYNASPTLSRFLRSDAFVRCVVGPVGSGKSSACVMEILLRAARQEAGPDGVRRTRFAVIRNTYSQLRDTTRKTFEKWIPQQLGRWHEQSFTFEIDHRLADGTKIHCEVLFRALDRPEDVRKLLSLELTGAYINEAREIPKNVLDVLEGRVGRYPSRDEGGATWFGIWMDTNPWHSGHWGAKLFGKGLDGYSIFRQPGGRSIEAENVDNLPPGYYDRLCVGKDREYVRVYVDGEDANGAVGSIWGAWVAELRARGGVQAFDHPASAVMTSWDLGRSDSTAIWFWRVAPSGSIHVLDYYENHNQGLSHYFGILESKGYAYRDHWLPHDARAKTLATQQTVLEQVGEWARKGGFGRVQITPDIGVDDGIAAFRWLLEQPTTLMHERCGAVSTMSYSGLDVLEEYRFEWNDVEQVFSKHPLHNWASHGADAARYMAVVARQMGVQLADKPIAPKLTKIEPVTFTLDDITAGRANWRI